MGYICTSVFVITIIIVQQSEISGKLVLSNLIFRHGHRTDDPATGYPNDPHIHETYPPYGTSQLTNEGKEKEFMIGKALRHRYHKFLNATYYPEILEAVTTDTSRTKMSLLLVLAGLFPPKGTPLDWNNELNWQPIPYNYVPQKIDIYFRIPNFLCPNYIKHYNAFMNSPTGLALREKYHDLFEFLSKETGKLVTDTLDVYLIYFHLLAQEEYGLELPSWAKSVYPDVLKPIATEQYTINSITTPLKKLSGGFLLKKMIDDMRKKISGGLKPQDRKMFLYSAHEYNIAHILNVLEVYYPHIPPYGAYILVELHEVDDVYGVKVFYQDYTSEFPELLIVAGCTAFCPMDQFVELLNKNIPDDGNACGEFAQNDEALKNIKMPT